MKPLPNCEILQTILESLNFLNFEEPSEYFTYSRLVTHNIDKMCKKRNNAGSWGHAALTAVSPRDPHSGWICRLRSYHQSISCYLFHST